MHQSESSGLPYNRKINHEGHKEHEEKKNLRVLCASWFYYPALAREAVLSPQNWLLWLQNTHILNSIGIRKKIRDEVISLHPL
jgi:hypothetical protein